MIQPDFNNLYFSYCAPKEADDSGVVTDQGPGVSTTNSVLSTVSPTASLDNLYLGEEADNTNKTIEALTITEYEGSPRRYGPKKQKSLTSHNNKTQHSKNTRPTAGTYSVLYLDSL